MTPTPRRGPAPALRATATAVRGAARAGAERVHHTAWAVVQCAIGATVAWLLARELLGHASPVFATVAATVCLGVSFGQRLRRVVELAVGVTIGVGLGDVLIAQIGRGWWQLGVIVALGMAFAQFLGGGSLVTNQAALQGVFLVALPQPDGGLSRWQDALFGGAVALAVAALLPPDPVRAVRTHAQLIMTELAEVVRLAASSVRGADAALADAALERARGTQGHLDRWQSALRDGEEISRISPLRRGRRDDLARYGRTLTGVDRAARNMRVAVRRIDASLVRGEYVPTPLAEVLDAFADALSELADDVERRVEAVDGARQRLVTLAVRLDPAALCADSLSSTVVVAQLRSAVVDLLEATGMDLDAARALLPR